MRTGLATSLALAAVLSPAPRAQPVAPPSLNVDLLAELGAHSGYTDVWGYRAPSGEELALLTTLAGVAVIDCTDPENPVERAFFSGPPAPLRDIKTYGPYAYVVSEGGGGLQIIDLTDPRSPRLATSAWGASQFSRAHNVAVDVGTGRIYAVGADVGMVVFDASVLPTAPPWLGIYGSASVGTYVHDLAVHNGVGHAAMVWNGVYRTLDVSTWPLQTLGEEPTAARFAHNVWPSADGRLAVATDEQEGGLIELWDVSDPTQLRSLAVYSPNTLAVPHNAFLVGDHCHASWYTEGYRVIDVADPSTPVEIGYYDTFAGPPGTNEGAFGVYPFQPSGVVYVSDRTRGLLVLRPHYLRIHHDALPDTESEDGPYRVVARVTSPDPIGSVTVYWSADGTSFSAQAATATGAPDEYAADLPGHLAPATLHYYLEATDAAGGHTRWPAPHAPEPLLRFDVGARLEVFADDFESASGWTSGASAGTDDWERGTTAALGWYSRVAWLDAQTAHSGTSLWGNDLGLQPGAEGAYPCRTSSWLQSPPIPTGSTPNLQLELWRWLNVDAADRARVLVNGQVVWQNPASRDLQEFTWHRQRIDVSGILSGEPTATVRFELQTDSSKELGGWNVDDVALFALGDCVAPVPYGAGSPVPAIAPRITLQRPARLGGVGEIGGAALPGGTAVLLLGARPLAVPVAGITLLVDPVGAATVPATVIAGAAVVPLAVPALPSLDDADLFAQWIAVEPGRGLAASAGLRVRVCGQ
ncbi:MAG: choice-of-anchor B family protein [Planctomycetota bacterium]